MNAAFSIALIGCGKMGGALLRGWLDNEAIASISVLDPQDAPLETGSSDKVTHYQSAADMSAALQAADIIVIAVKPQIMGKACEQIAAHISAQALVLSIAAGQTIASFERRFSETQPIIRTMPNTPASIGKGMTVACGNSAVSDEQKAQAQNILSASGLIEWSDDENILNAVTAISGSGPAYIFLLIEILAKAGEKEGLPPELAMTLARQTVIGSAALAEDMADTPAAILRENVTSPGGTTEAALKILMNGALQTLFDQAVKAAVKRGEELSA